MKTQHISRIPIAQIRVVNPRSRNRKTFRGIITNVEAVGLKKPITVFRREPEGDGTCYDLVCGQGRLEAVVALGDAHIPAIVTDAPLKKRYLMSLIENVARKRPPLSDLLREVRHLRSRGYTKQEIAKKLGMGRTYVEGVLRLLRSGEERLVKQVEAGSIPLSVAIRIAASKGSDVQGVLSKAYDAGELRGARLIAVQRLIAQRNSERRPESPEGQLASTSEDLVREYERHTEQQRALVKRADQVQERLALLTTALKILLADREFRKLLRSEGLDSMPKQLAVRLA